MTNLLVARITGILSHVEYTADTTPLINNTVVADSMLVACDILVAELIELKNAAIEFPNLGMFFEPALDRLGERGTALRLAVNQCIKVF